MYDEAIVIACTRTLNVCKIKVERYVENQEIQKAQEFLQDAIPPIINSAKMILDVERQNHILCEIEQWVRTLNIPMKCNQSQQVRRVRITTGPIDKVKFEYEGDRSDGGKIPRRRIDY